MIRRILARGLKNYGGIVDLAYSATDLEGAVVTDFKTDTKSEDIEVLITLKTKDDEIFIIRLVQENHN